MHDFDDANASSHADRHRSQIPAIPLDNPHPLSPDSSHQGEKKKCQSTVHIESTVPVDPSSSVSPASVLTTSDPAPSIVIETKSSSVDNGIARKKEPLSGPEREKESLSAVPLPVEKVTPDTSIGPRRSKRTRRAPDRLTPTALGQFVASYDTIPHYVFSSFFNDNGLPSPIDFTSRKIQVEDVHGNPSDLSILG